MQDVFREAVSLLEKDDQLVVATVIRTKGSTPQKPGAKLLVRKDGTGVGTLGGGCVEGDIWFEATQLMKRGGSALYREYELNEDLAAEDGLVCGGTMFFLIDPIYSPDEYLPYAREIEAAYQGKGPVAVATLIKPAAGSNAALGSKLFVRGDGSTEGALHDAGLDEDAGELAQGLMIHGKSEYVVADNGAEYFVEAFTTPPQLVICGGGHVSKAIAAHASSLGFRLFITDDREEFANRQRFPDANMVVAKAPEEALQDLPINPNTFIIVVTRGHRFDAVALAAAAATEARYVGLMGSKRKTILIYEDLVRMGVPVDRIREVRSPIGLDIKARTPEEIAISIIAEVLLFRLGGTGLPMKLEQRQIDRIVAKVEAEKALAVAD
ncbi:MAG: XdhC family protein [SAR202 cluster bacterium]|jgi:xanthine dehydrogenase accessory factor|nr:XdhC family protein [SAR202 cluster bacterium]MDP6799008.1 XdhC family protein [SAR202 cluster bacterium]|tara:strand:+ start:706 stop:1848 length:1143 start_codon:yes stop_codon:yes gene_type:complete